MAAAAASAAVAAVAVVAATAEVAVVAAVVADDRAIVPDPARAAADLPGGRQVLCTVSHPDESGLAIRLPRDTWLFASTRDP